MEAFKRELIQVMAWDKNSQEGQFITGLDAERVIVNEMRKKVTKKICFAIFRLKGDIDAQISD